MLMPGPVNLFADIGIVYAFQHSNIAGKAVIACLVFGSIFSWSVMVSKIYMIRRAKSSTRRFLKRFRTARKPLAIYQNRETYSDCPTYLVYLAGCRNSRSTCSARPRSTTLFPRAWPNPSAFRPSP